MTDVFRSGGMGTDDVTGRTFKTLSFSATLNGSGAAFKDSGSDYAVAAGKTFYATGLWIIGLSNGVGGTAQLGYADDAAQTTNRVAKGPATPQTTIASGGMPNVIPLIGITMPAGKYVGFYAAANPAVVTAFLYGYEE